MEVAGQGDQAESGGELACTSASQFSPASGFVGFNSTESAAPYLPRPQVWASLEEAVLRGLARWWRPRTWCSRLFALFKFRILKFCSLCNTERLPESM